MDLSLLNINFWIIQSLAMGLTALVLPRLRITSIYGATIMVVALALVNAHIWDAALFFSFPDTISIHALTLFVSNGLIFWILVKLLPGIEVTGFLPALVAPAVFSLISLVLNTYGSQIDFLAIGEKGLTEIEATRDQLKKDHKESEKTREKE